MSGELTGNGSADIAGSNVTILTILLASGERRCP